ncbi:hypothetical protein J6590_077775 [Homalodisca vitripennis]|nr:hypothetical protein J6590_077775 [Homalodisca vitripennis]
MENTFEKKEALVSVFMDIEGAFDRVAYQSMETAMERFGVPASSQFSDAACAVVKNVQN